ncbi:MAG: DNA repair protein RadA, partial [Acidimicrobiales bacterium]
MTRSRLLHRCGDCGATNSRWLGRCPACGAWNSLVEETAPLAGVAGSWQAPAVPSRPVPIAEVDLDRCGPRSTGLGEFDRVLGGGL